ncbi:MAG: DUF460 domain-containing protein [Candidatus Micrarchaeia archaeon]
MHIIIGLDTGKTIAIAALDLNGKLIITMHKSSVNVEWIIHEIEKIGSPSIIAYDKIQPQEIVKKVSAAFNCKIYLPHNTITVKEKQQIAKTYNIKNAHERDALTSAIKAYNYYSNKLNQVEHKARENSIEDIDYLKAKVINKHSVKEAISKEEVFRK